MMPHWDYSKRWPFRARSRRIRPGYFALVEIYDLAKIYFAVVQNVSLFMRILIYNI